MHVSVIISITLDTKDKRLY